MASITIRNLDESVKKALRQRAAANNRSMEEEARRILDAELFRDSRRPGEGLGSWIARRFAEIGGAELLIPPRTEMPRKPPFVTDEEWLATEPRPEKK
jgi:plasmid stability protein